LDEEMKAQDAPIPHDKWFENLSQGVNVESASFSYAFMLSAVV